MNYKMVFRIVGLLLIGLGALMILPLLAGLHFAENVDAFLITIVICMCLGLLFSRIKPETNHIFAREGFAIVSLGWISMSLLGALPFVISGNIPSYIDALFETVSGFTTTGATVVQNVEGMSRACLFWRLFTHWIGGMGVLVFVMAVMPMSGDHSMHIMRAEVPGPVVSKLVPRAKKSAKILYLIYLVMTLIETGFLMGGGMNFYEALLHSFSTAGTGGFSTRAASIAAFNSLYIEMVISVFMLLFSLNFNLYYLILIGHAKEALKSEEMHTFLGIVIAAVIFVSISIRNMYSGIGEALRHAFFNVSTLISTTGFGTVDFDTWPEYSKWVLLGIMLIGGCAGSTAGGLKVSRIIILVKSAFADVKQMVHPRSVNIVRLDGRRVNEETVKATQTYFAFYMTVIIISAMLVSFDTSGIVSSFSASIACISNVGPGLEKVGPTMNYAFLSDFSKIVLSIEMLMGRLEIYPILMLFYPQMWKGEKVARGKKR